MVLFVYAVISPLTPLITGMCFLFMMSMYKHQFIFIYPAHFDSGGKLWANFIQIILSCMLIAQITILGLLGLKKAGKQIPIFIPLLVISILFSMYIRQMHFRVAQYLPTHEALTEEDSLRDKEFDFNFLRGAYVQPALGVDARVSPDDSLTGEKEAALADFVEKGVDKQGDADIEQTVTAAVTEEDKDEKGEENEILFERAEEGNQGADKGAVAVDEAVIEVDEGAVEVTP
mmetsp:Transcript_11208/g.30938  ORF Transcript_11208/g.30938 Transcript_11208/m.30938 type:complete len:231 (+) Transcript_11208:1-693(+)